ncbi:MAG: chromosome partitioning protein ParB, partial [Eubacteriales bacterium]|nr:chromosome partitioning protein ParB [Eubacteriales bacterium]
FGVRDDEEMAELVESISTFGVINPVIVCELSMEEAIIFMVDSNLQREHILPSQRAKAYQMKMDVY